MSAFSEYKRRALIPLAGLVLGAYFVFVFLPLQQASEDLDDQLRPAWKKLSGLLHHTNATALDFAQITNQLSETRCALDQLETARQRIASRLEAGPALRARLSAPFQILEYESERSKLKESVSKQAQALKIALSPEVLAGFPEHTADMQQPAWLWAALSLVNNFLSCALQCKVSALHWLDSPLNLTNAPMSDAPGRWTEIPLQVEFTAPAANAAQLIQSLPLRADEVRAAGLPQAPADKLPLFVDRLVIRKQSPEKLDEVRVWLRLVGFVSRE